MLTDAIFFSIPHQCPVHPFKFYTAQPLFSHLPLSTSNTASSFIPKLLLKHFYKVWSARSKNNWKQSWCISCSHPSYSDQSLSPGPAPTSHQSLCRALGMWPSGMLGNEGWQGASRHPITSLVGKKGKICRALVYIYSWGIQLLLSCRGERVGRASCFAHVREERRGQGDEATRERFTTGICPGLLLTCRGVDWKALMTNHKMYGHQTQFIYHMHRPNPENIPRPGFKNRYGDCLNFSPWLWYGFMDGDAGRSLGPPLWSRLKYLSRCWMDFCEILCRHSCSPEDESQWLWWAVDFSPL